MTDYQPGHLKHNLETFEIAIRTTFPETDEAMAEMAWWIVHPRFGPRHVTSDKVAAWADLYTPEPPPA